MKSFRFIPLFLAFSSSVALAAPEVPSRPEFGVRDDASVLPLPILKATERVFAQHERLTDERISLVTMAGLAKGESAGFTDRVFDEWRQTAPRPSNFVLIVVDVDRGELEIRTGIGLDPVLPVVKIADIRGRFFRGEWDAGKKSRAVVLSVVEVLRGLGSPLVAEGEAAETYERAGFPGGWTPAVRKEKTWMPWILAFFGIAAAAFVLVRIQIGEVHYTAAGWFPIPASRGILRFFRRRHRGPAFVTGGGVSGNY